MTPRANILLGRRNAKAVGLMPRSGRQRHHLITT